MTLSACIPACVHRQAFTPTGGHPVERGVEFQITLEAQGKEKGPYQVKLWVKIVETRHESLTIRGATATVMGGGPVGEVEGVFFLVDEPQKFDFLPYPGLNVSNELIPLGDPVEFDFRPDQTLEIQLDMRLESKAGEKADFTIFRTFEASEMRWLGAVDLGGNEYPIYRKFSK